MSGAPGTIGYHMPGRVLRLAQTAPGAELTVGTSGDTTQSTTSPLRSQSVDQAHPRNLGEDQ